MPVRKHSFLGFSTSLIVGVTCILAISFAVLSIHSAGDLDTGLRNEITHHSNVSTALHAVRKSLAEMHAEMRNLLLHKDKDYIQTVSTNLDNLQTSIFANDNYIIKHYTGSTQESLELHATLVKIFDEQYLILNSISTFQQPDLLRTLSEKLVPLYARSDTISSHMLTVIEAATRRMLSHSQDTLQWTILFAISIAALMVILACIFQRVTSGRIKEREYRDYVLRIVSENSGNVFFVYNLQARAVEFASPNSQPMLGIDSHKLESDPLKLFDYAEHDQLAEIRSYFIHEVLQIPLERECQFLNPLTGSSVWTLLTIAPVREHGVVSRYIVSLADVTEIRKAQGALRDALLNAQTANRAKSDFLSRMSHEIRTPLNVIIGMQTVAASSLHDAHKTADCLAKASMASRHLLMLINDVLDMAKIESGKFTITRESFNFAELIQNLTVLIHQQARQKNLHFEVLMANIEHEHMIGDALRVNQILLNILSNALKFTPENGIVRLSVKEIPTRSSTRTRIHFTITDTGIGMSQEFIDKLFNPFEQENKPSRSAIVGTGLGMAITGNLVSLLGGSIQVSSTPGEGSVFIVDLDFDLDTAESSRPCLPELAALRVLIADSNQDTSEHLSGVLKRIGVQAERIFSVQAALDAVRSMQRDGQALDILFVDWNPDADDALRMIRSLRTAAGPEMAIIGTSDTDWSTQEEAARQAGMTDSLIKPLFQSSLYNSLLRVTHSSGPIVQAKRIQLNGRRLLLVEDNELNMEIALEILRPSGVLCECATNGREALTLFTNAALGHFDAVLMDIQMPEMDGYQAARALRQLERPDALLVPIIAMTANAFAEDVTAALAAGMNAHISKPIDPSMLIQTISDELTKRNAAALVGGPVPELRPLRGVLHSPDSEAGKL